MGNIENKNRNPPPNSRRAVAERVFNQLLPNSRIYGRTVDGYEGILKPTTEHDGECPVCFQPAEILLQFSTCSHMACTACWLTFMCTEINSFAMSRLTCIGCKEPLSAFIVVNMLTTASKDPSLYKNSSSGVCTVMNCSQMLSRYEEFLLRRSLASEPDIRWCPSGCGYGLIAHGFKQCPRIPCPRAECNGRSFCYNCQRPWVSEEIGHTTAATSTSTSVHVCTLDTENRSDAVEGIFAFLGIRQLRRLSSTQLDRGSSRPSGLSPTAPHGSLGISVEENDVNLTEAIPFVDDPDTTDEIVPIDLEEGVRRSSTSSRKSSSSEIGEVKPCPNCMIPIQKLNDGSCNSMVCSICGHDFCWLCLQPVRFGHYFSLSGCTVWGKQKWTPRRRVVILLVILFGTPVILPVAVALSIPLGTLGFVFLCFSATNCAMKQVNKHARRFALFCVSLGGLLIAPIFCGFLAALLIPIALLYAYLYLPVSMLSSIYKRSHPPLHSGDSQTP